MIGLFLIFLYGLGVGLTSTVLWTDFLTYKKHLSNGWIATIYKRGRRKVLAIVMLGILCVLWPLAWTAALVIAIKERKSNV